MNYDEIFAKNYDQLNAAQRQAVDKIAGPVLVIAGPGTGKTQLLSTRIAKILRDTDANPDNILAMTFTESGAAAMRERLATIIGAKSAYAVGIYTYHGFANQLYLSQREIFGDRQITDLESYALAEKIFARLPRQSYLNNGAPKQAKEVSGLIHDLKRNDVSPQDLYEIADENAVFAKTINEKFATFDFDSLASGGENDKLAHWRDFAKLFDGAPDEKRKIPRLAKSISDKMQMLLDRAEKQISLDRDARDRDKRGKIISPFKDLGAYRDTILEKDGAGKTILNKQFSNAQLKEIAKFYEDYDGEKLANGVYDYDDMILNAKKILEEIDEVRETLAAKYQYILLDEFQDTNKTQLAIVELLAAGKKNPNVMAVGDDDQGIMSFQGAEFGNMQSFADHFHVQHVISLSENYRSAAPIIEFAENIIGGQIDENGSRDKNDGADDRFIDDPEIRERFPELKKDLVAKRRYDDFGIDRKLFRMSSAEYSWLVDKIHQLSPDGKKLNDIAVIAPKHDLLEEISRYFLAAKIPVTYEAKENILDDKTLSEFLDVMRLAARLSDSTQNADAIDSLWPAVLAQNWWNIDPSSVFRASRQVKKMRQNRRSRDDFSEVEWSEILEQSDDPILRDATKKIEQLAGLTKNNSALEMINFASGRTPLDSQGSKMPILAALEKTETAYLHFVGQLNILAKKFADFTAVSANDQPQDLANFLEMCDEYDAAEIKIADTNPYTAGENSVQLMTAHHSKGLEFDHVFIVNADDNSWDSAGKSPKIALPENLKFVRAPKDKNERIRVFFVAITRAKKHLYVTSSERDLDGKSRDALMFLDEKWERDDDGKLKNDISRKIPRPFQKISDDARNATVTPAELEVHWQQFYEPARIKPRELLHDQIANFEISAHALSSYYDVRFNGPQVFYTRYLLGFPDKQNPQVDFGSVVHDVFDQLTKHPAKFSGDDETKLDKMLALTRNLLVAKGAADNLDNELKRARQSFANLLKLRPELFNRDPNVAVKSEQKFDHIPLLIDGKQILLNGRLDRIEIDANTKKIAIVDWKTGKIDDKKIDKFPYRNRNGNWSGEYKLWQYEIQMYFYRILLENSLEFKRDYLDNGYTFAPARLEFIEGNLTPEAQPIVKTVDFEPEKMNAIYRMVKHLSAQIDELSFPDIWPDAKNDVAQIMAFTERELQREK